MPIESWFVSEDKLVWLILWHPYHVLSLFHRIGFSCCLHRLYQAQPHMQWAQIQYSQFSSWIQASGVTQRVYSHLSSCSMPSIAPVAPYASTGLALLQGVLKCTWPGCDDITKFPLFFPYFSIPLCSAASTPLHSTADPWSTDFLYCVNCCCALHSLALLCWQTWPHSIHETWCMTRTDTIEMHPAGAYSTILHCLGFICTLYKLILDEGYVLTQHLDPIDAFCVCPALRLRPIHSTCWDISILTHFTPWTSSPSWFTSLPSLADSCP